MKKVFLVLLTGLSTVSAFASLEEVRTHTYKNPMPDAVTPAIIENVDVSLITPHDNKAYINKATFEANGVVITLILNEADGGKKRTVNLNGVTNNLELKLSKADGTEIFNKTKKVDLATLLSDGQLSLDTDTEGEITVTWNPTDKTNKDAAYTLEYAFKNQQKVTKASLFIVDTTPPVRNSITGMHGTTENAINTLFDNAAEVSDRYVRYTFTYSEDVMLGTYGTEYNVQSGGVNVLPGGQGAPIVAYGSAGNHTVTVTIDHGEEYTDDNGVVYMLQSDNSLITDYAGNPMIESSNP